MKVEATDAHSGIDSYTLTGPSYNKTQKSSSFTVTLPGIYTLTVTDKVGNSSSKQVEVNVYYPIHITWNGNAPDELKPKNITLQAKDGNTIVKEVVLPMGSTDYTFKDLPINSNYTFDLIVSDRYDIAVNNQNIVVTYQSSNFSVKIPKNIVLDGRTGNADYSVIVNGTFYYNDILIVQPDSSFILTDRSSISSMQANITQPKTGFSKEDLKPSSTASGHIQVNRTYFSGIWKGNYHFNIKFLRKN